MYELLAANVLAVAGQLVAIHSSTRNDKKQILLLQGLSIILMMSASIILKGYSALVIDALGLSRNILSYYSVSFKGLPYVYIALSIVFGLYFNNLKIVGLFPIVANAAQSLIFLNKRSTTKQIQLVSGFATLCWAVYDFAIMAYASVFFDAISAISYFYNALKKDKDN